MKRTDKISQMLLWGRSVLLLFFAVTTQAIGQTTIQSFDASRSICEASFVAGAGWSVARSILTLQPQGYTFGTGIPVVTPEALVGVDIFVIGQLGTSLSAEEICVLENFVKRGGAVLDTRNMAFPSIFGVEQISFGGTGLANALNSSDPNVAPIVAGVSQPLSVGANSVLTTGTGIPFLYDLARTPSQPIAVIFPPTSGRLGRAAIIGDEEVFMNAFGTCIGAPYGLNPNNQQLMVNIFAYLSEAPGLAPDALATLQTCVIKGVTIDIKPGSFPNSITPGSQGVIPVAVLTTDTFDATSVNPTTVFFGKTGTNAAAVHSALEDVDGDGNTDMIFHFIIQNTGIQCGDTAASLTGKTLSGQTLVGSDSIRTVGCR